VAAQLIRFVAASACALAVKVVLTLAFARFLPDHASYLLTHVVVFFWSYYTQARFTFRVSHSPKRMVGYLKAVLLIKLLDYGLFTVVLAVARERLTLSIVIASLAISLLRFTQVRRALRKGVVPAPVGAEGRQSA
jgi:uncharacterized membrane protein YjgN (DUF898 family)